MAQSSSAGLDSSAPQLDLTNCDREPIHIPGSIQPHGVLLAVNGPNLHVVQASENVSVFFGVAAESLIGKPLDTLLAVSGWREAAEDIRNHVASPTPVCVRTATLGEYKFRVLVHRGPEATLVEFELADTDREISFPDLYPIVWSFMNRLHQLSGEDDLTHFAAAEIRRITGFDRVLVYRFDENWNGTVVAEDRNENLPSYYDLRFPASDIPAQARQLYRINRIRLIANADYQPVPLVPAFNPETGRPLDLSHAALRSVSPVHLEYMRNMGTAASMSISILREGDLWGLISCHHATPRNVGFDVRTTCDLVSQVFSLQLSARERANHYEGLLQLRRIHARLLAAMAARDNFVDGLASAADDLQAIARASGAAVLFGGACRLAGDTPGEMEVRALVDFLAESGKPDVWFTDRLTEEFPGARAHAETVSGVLAVSISRLHRSYVLWFRPEVIQTVKWGGDPRKPAEPGETPSRLHPRTSFDMWRETVRGYSMPWTQAEIEAVTELRNSIVGIVLRRAEEMAELTSELERSNKELEAFSYSVSHDLRAPFRHIVGYAELLSDLEKEKLTDTGKRYIQTIIESAQYAGTLVDNLLMFSQIGRSALNRVPVDMNSLVRDVVKRLAPDCAGRNIRFEVAPLPSVEGDAMLLRLTLQNLLSNALKYTRNRPEAVIEVGATVTDDEIIYHVRDNGVGFDMRYYEKLFGVFQRLHRMEEFEGTGIGLANVRRIIARHGGRTWAEGAIDRGATFWFALPGRRGETEA